MCAGEISWWGYYLLGSQCSVNVIDLLLQLLFNICRDEVFFVFDLMELTRVVPTYADRILWKKTVRFGCMLSTDSGHPLPWRRKWKNIIRRVADKQGIDKAFVQVPRVSIVVKQLLKSVHGDSDAIAEFFSVV